MNGGPSQFARQLQAADAKHRERLEGWNRASHADALRELQLEPAETLQPDDDCAAIGDWRALIASLGVSRILAAAAFAAIVWTATATFAIMCGAGQ